jgi:hypothetical protein
MFSIIIFELASDQAAQFLRCIAERHGEFAIVFQRLNGLAALTFQSVNALVRPFARIPTQSAFIWHLDRLVTQTVPMF